MNREKQKNKKNALAFTRDEKKAKANAKKNRQQAFNLKTLKY